MIGEQPARRSLIATLLRALSVPWAAEAVALLAGLVYLVQSFAYAHNQQSVLDEGTYLTKGMFFLTGQFRLYQEYGPWSNHMPLAFYLPGFAQALFGAGLRTGRYLSVFWGVLMLLGVWVLIRRITSDRGTASRWWAAGALLAIALNPAQVRMFSMAVTQSLIACLFVWMVVFSLGEGRSLKEIILAGVLAGAMVLVRINMVIVLPIMVLYVFWQHRRKAGTAVTLAAGLVFLLGHALFWPGILQLWAYWLPREVTPFLNNFRLPEGYLRLWDPNTELLGRIVSFFHGFRYNFAAAVGILLAWLLWPRSGDWKRRSDYRSAVYLSALFLSLWLVHLWATLGKDYCVFCLAGYITFFMVAALALVALSFPVWRQRLPVWRQGLVLLVLVALATGIAFSAFEDYGWPLLNLRIPRFLLGSGATGSVTVVQVLQILLPGREYAFFRRAVPAAAGLGSGLLLLALSLLAARALARRQPGQTQERSVAPSAAYLASVTFLLAGTLLAPMKVLSGGYRTYACGGNVIAAYETAGEQLAALIPPGSHVYWKGGHSPAPLLYVPGVQVYAPQLNGDYSYYVTGDTNSLYRLGFWNEELAHRWAGEADFILIQERFYEGWLKDWVNNGGYVEAGLTAPTAPCGGEVETGSPIHVFRRVP